MTDEQDPKKDADAPEKAFEGVERECTEVGAGPTGGGGCGPLASPPPNPSPPLLAPLGSSRAGQ